MTTLQLHLGYELIYDCPQATPMVLMLTIHHSRVQDIVVPDQMITEPFVPQTWYFDGFGNRCSRLVAPRGRLRLCATALLNDNGEPDTVPVAERQHPVEELPEEALVYLLGSRYCETDRLTNVAWDLFGHSAPGAHRVQAICDYVHQQITFGYSDARPTKTAWEALEEGKGVCRGD